MDMIGKKIGRYEIQAHIGEGGMAQVYQAFDPQINRTVALKILKDEHCQEEEHRKRFIREGKAAGALAHPNIVTIYDVGEFKGTPYIMMELIEGETLGDLLSAEVLLPLETILKIAIQLADALDYAHRKGVVHRDLKPDNIVLSADYESLRIADFGVARVKTLGEQERTQAGMMLGTPRYMSPEQAKGERVDGRSDLFSLGVILYETITGKQAFAGESIPTLMMQIIQKTPQPVRQLKANVPVGVQKIVETLLQKKPERRFQTGTELRQSLQRELEAYLEEKKDSGYLSIQIKWTAIMSAIVAVAMMISSYLIINAQHSMLTEQAVDSGVTLSKFVAVQAAIPLLGEDWVTLDSFVQDAAARHSFSYLMVTDHTGEIRVASDQDLVGQPWTADDTAELIFEQESIQVRDRGDVFNFSTAVMFNQTVVGGVHMGLETRTLEGALKTTRNLMLALAWIVVIAVAGAIYVFNKQITRNLLLSTKALTLLGSGQLDIRISKRRADEFGDLFTAFNSLADSLENVVDDEALQKLREDGASTGGVSSSATDISGITKSHKQNADSGTSQDDRSS